MLMYAAVAANGGHAAFPGTFDEGNSTNEAGHIPRCGRA